MSVSKSELQSLKKLQNEFDKYHKLVVSVYRIYNHRDYPSQQEINKRIDQEKKARRTLNVNFGKVEKTVYNLLGGKPMMQIPAIPGYQWDIFAEALSSNFETSSKGQCLDMAIDSIDRAVGKAEGIASSAAPITTPITGENIFEESLIEKINDNKIQELCREFNNVYGTNPNAGALLFRTILLISLQYKLGTKAKDDLSSVLNQAVSSNIYKDTHITRVLKNFQGVPKTLLDATHHSKWILINGAELVTWAQGLRLVLGATFK